LTSVPSVLLIWIDGSQEGIHLVGKWSEVTGSERDTLAAWGYPEKTGRNCIFCGDSGPLSKEEMWPTWLCNIFPDPPSMAYVARTDRAEETGGFTIGLRDRIIDKPGVVAVRQLKITCEGCNNGWMSRLQNDAKPILLPIGLR
jgi:hypothetical protein